VLLSTAAGIHQTIDYLWATTLPSTDLVMLVILSIIKRQLSLLNVIHILDVNHHFIILSPPADLNIICFPFQDPLHCLQLLNFSRMIKKCQSYFCLGFYKLDRWPFVWKLLFIFFCFGINFSNFKDHVYSNLIIATKSRDVNFESIF
jgi:hypothetical protein